MTEGRLAPEEVRTRTFNRVVRGYKRREVRRLLERAATDLARLRNGITSSGPDDQLPLTPEEVEEARFQASLGGYEMDEVDEFLDQLVVELERAAREPLRPPSALPAPPRPGLFPPAHGFRPAGAIQEEAPGPDTEVPIARADEPAAALSVGPVAGPGADPGAAREAEPADGPDADLPADQWRLGARVEPPVVARQPPPAGPFPASHTRPGAGPLPAAQPPASPAHEPRQAQPPPEEGFFPPPSVPPSAAPAPTPPPPPAQRPSPLSSARPLTPSEVETRSFDRGAPGYLPTHVDLFLAKAARALAGRDGETMNRWDVLRQRFPLGPRGYATSEVDAFLVRLAAQFPEPDQTAQEEILRRLQQRADGP
jgi:DivIVA domain-containing protein